MEQANAATEAPKAPKVSTVKSVNLHPAHELVEIHTRPLMALRDEVTVLPFTVIEGMFLTILQMRLNARGVGVALAQMPPG